MVVGIFRVFTCVVDRFLYLAVSNGYLFTRLNAECIIYNFGILESRDLEAEDDTFKEHYHGRQALI